MISCNKGICKVTGNTIEIEADLTTLIHAIDMTFTESFGKDEAKERIKECFDFALATRDIPADEDLSREEREDINNNLKRTLSDLIDLAASIMKEVDDGN